MEVEGLAAVVGAAVGAAVGGEAAADVAAEGEGCFDFTWSRGFFGDIRQITSWASMELVRGEGGNRNRRGMVAYAVVGCELPFRLE